MELRQDQCGRLRLRKPSRQFLALRSEPHQDLNQKERKSRIGLKLTEGGIIIGNIIGTLSPIFGLRFFEGAVCKRITKLAKVFSGNPGQRTGSEHPAHFTRAEV
jgi:hypothetical protein